MQKKKETFLYFKPILFTLEVLIYFSSTLTESSEVKIGLMFSFQRQSTTDWKFSAPSCCYSCQWNLCLSIHLKCRRKAPAGPQVQFTSRGLNRFISEALKPLLGTLTPNLDASTFECNKNEGIVLPKVQVPGPKSQTGFFLVGPKFSRLQPCKKVKENWAEFYEFSSLWQWKYLKIFWTWTLKFQNLKLKNSS